MNIQSFLRLLSHVHGPNASGEWMARCPCHDDKTASLSVGVKRDAGRDRIVFDCKAGCDGRDILQRLGITTAQLYDPEQATNGDRKGGRKGSAKDRQDSALVPGHEVHTAPGAKNGDTRTQSGAPGQPDRESAAGPAGPKWDLSRPAKVYQYRGLKGEALFEVCRYETTFEGKRVKTFRQRRYAPEEPNANAAGYVWSVPDAIRDTTLYRMPELMEAIRAGRTVYLVEGEKDVETLARLGVPATCNPGGAGKWREGHTARLIGADVVILPDNDPADPEHPDKGRTGQKHAWAVAQALTGKAKRIRIVDLTQCSPDLPSKGDVSDLVAQLGDRPAMDALGRALAATRDFDPDAPQYWLSPMEQAEILYREVQGYGVERGGIVQYQQSGFKPLTNFIPLLRQELIRDDGVTRSLRFVLDGWTASGRQLPRVDISAKDLDSMGWVTDKWGVAASVTPGSTNGPKVAWAIKGVGQRTAKRVTEYLHTGWREIEGEWCYLYEGGAVGRDGVTVNMEGCLKQYQLGGSEDISFADGARMSLRLMSVLSPDLATALLGLTYLAPLREWMAQTDTGPAFCLYLHGITGTHKSTAAALAMAHFGNFHSKNPPASFSDTPNQIRRKAFLVKDMPLLVDDYHPTNSVMEARQMAATAQAISRAFGDGSDRGRLNADRTLSGSQPPRSVAMITGEDLPQVGESGLARYYIVEIGRNDVPITKDLTELQEAAREGYLQRAMRGYITWLSRQTDRLADDLHEMYIKYRETVRTMTEGAHDRAPETVTCLLMGYQMMLLYFRDIGVIDQDTAKDMGRQAIHTLVEATRRQARETRAQKPSVIFTVSLAELLASGDAGVVDLMSPAGEKAIPPDHMIGYMDQQYYYFLPSVAFSAVSELCRKQETRFPVTLKGLYKHLKEDGVCGDAVSADAITRNKRINGRAMRLLWIPRHIIDGGHPPRQQTFTEVEDDTDPFKNDEP